MVEAFRICLQFNAIPWKETNKAESIFLKSFPEPAQNSIHFQLAGEQKQRNKFAFLPFFTHPHDAKSKVKRETRGNLLSQVATTTSECIFQAGRWKAARKACTKLLPPSVALNSIYSHSMCGAFPSWIHFADMLDV